MTTTTDTPVLSLKDVGLRLGGRDVLRDVSMNVQPGEFVGIIGANGAGKTSLLRVILGLLTPSHGTVRILGQPPGRANRVIGYAPQRRQIDPDTPVRGRDLVALGLDGDRWGVPLRNHEAQRRIDDALDAVGARPYADAPVGRLSGGEQQRLLLAQVLLGQPAVLLLDEPLASLDLRNQAAVVDLVAHLGRARNVAVLFVSHDVNPLLHVMDRVLYLANGRAAVGPVDEVVTTAVLSRLYGSPVQVLRVGDALIVAAASGRPLDLGDCRHV
jgi:zinc/manganese transport system ATP-binding protein